MRGRLVDELLLCKVLHLVLSLLKCVVHHLRCILVGMPVLRNLLLLQLVVHEFLGLLVRLLKVFSQVVNLVLRLDQSGLVVIDVNHLISVHHFIVLGGLIQLVPIDALAVEETNWLADLTPACKYLRVEALRHTFKRTKG